MSPKAREIFTDVYRFYEKLENLPKPPYDNDNDDKWWEGAVNTMESIYKKHDKCKLVKELLTAVFEVASYNCREMLNEYERNRSHKIQEP